MNMSCLLALAMVGVVSAQVQPASIQPGRANSGEIPRSETENKSSQLAGPPILGYVVRDGGRELETIAGKFNVARLGDQIPVPSNTSHVYLPPRQLFAMVEKTSDQPMQIWALSAAGTFKQAGLELTGVTAHPDMVAFSPRGTAALVYSQANSSLQPVTQLPAEPALGKQLTIPGSGMPISMAISDDGRSVVAALPDGRVIRSGNGAGWTNLAVSLTPKAWTFDPNSHDLVISDVSRKLIALVPEASGDLRILDQNVEADQLAFTKGGEQLVAGSSREHQIWAIELKSGDISPKQTLASVDLLTPLRDGFTFLVATSPSVSVLRFSPSQSN